MLSEEKPQEDYGKLLSFIPKNPLTDIIEYVS
ncbi:MAG: hypothetical protein UY39_C0064G0007 [Candidatus Kaiserbacteria bacterium GW2011_GWC2_49_12]|uniref:Uncharacterized protein n=2 Tax=Candidatus Kaiseribacteriota TaxID=1752734 RepID=A0A0G1WGH4_9BACT|nr:MAG: hypothetical protein UY39_C0064G0007 [Candidatus Kaiserbacteria bacterium GW2011_GWC2_49_12]KKW17898.1 MAG: hypothetical protein UY59_C0022G0008 [Candidatus Kaiserbacteria bacterium GW2011_GWA1_50_28]